MIGIGTDSARRIARVVRRDEQRPYNEVGQGSASDGGFETHPVQITSTTQTDGMYPGSLYQRTASGFTLLGTAGGIWVDTPNGETLTTGRYYYTRRIGTKTADGKNIHEAFASTGYSGVGVQIVATANNTHVSFTTAAIAFRNWDTDTYFSAGTPTYLTVPTTAKYSLSVNAEWGIIVASSIVIYLIYNGSTEGIIDCRHHVNGGIQLVQSCGVQLSLTAGDRIGIMGDSPSGVSISGGYVSLSRLG